MTRRPARDFLSGLALASLLALAGCAAGQSPAERAITSVETSWAGMRERVRVLSPHRAAAIELALARARAAGERGDWIGAMAATQSLPGEIQSLNVELEAEERELDARWDSVNVALARTLPEVDAAIEQVATARRLPPGVSPGDVADARADLQAARIAWAHAVTA
ncbi:MAG: hypothetical protein ABIP29_05335, partial [Candidatus Eisenbacteria bacterium]